MTMKHGSFSLSNEHYTPLNIIEMTRELFDGVIDLDPASCLVANKYLVKASNYYNIKQDGLQQEWKANTVFLNPPGGKINNKSSQSIWFNKLNNHYLNGDIKQAMYVAFNLEILRICQNTLNYPICFLQDRLRYIGFDHINNCLREGTYRRNADGSLYYDKNGELVWINSPTHATCLIYVGKQVKRFVSLCNDYKLGKVKV